MNATLGIFQKAMREIPGLAREFARLYGLPETCVTPQLIYVETLAHEFGHTLEFKDHAQDPAAYKEATKREKAAMPLGNVIVSQLIKTGTPQNIWLHENLDALLTQTGSKTLEEMIEKQHLAYRGLSGERAADAFAIEVIISIPGLLDNLITPMSTDELRQKDRTYRGGINMHSNPDRFRIQPRRLSPQRRILSLTHRVLGVSRRSDQDSP